ncbi:DNA sulfur modification protein DndB [Kitasatospora sp. NPDC002227]|uniref:DNA sulfur modification protein DndB n=1 Tax=Kitasatospora sp. NPDC002227 TaxID=3154773 RepID=UPI0033275952
MAILSQDRLDPSVGCGMRCMLVDDFTTHIKADFRLLRVITHDPVVLQSTSRNRPVDVTDRDVELHALVQRALEGSKKANVTSYARYIERHVMGEIAGVLPPIHLWTEQSLAAHQDNGETFLCVPYGERLIAIDGETQLASHYYLQKSPNVPDEVKARHEKLLLTAVVHDNRTAAQARQFFHDLNVLAVRPNTSIGLSMDTADPLMQVVTKLSQEIPFFRGRVEQLSRQLKRNTPKVVTLQALRQCVINIAHGMSGVQYGARPAPMTNVDLQALEAVATRWLVAYTDAFEREFSERDEFVAGVGSVLAAVGAMAHPILDAAADTRDELLEGLLVSLRQVDWRKGDHWIGTVLSKTPKGTYTTNGPKQSAYAVYSALCEPGNAAYQGIRRRAEATAG